MTNGFDPNRAVEVSNRALTATADLYAQVLAVQASATRDIVEAVMARRRAMAPGPRPVAATPRTARSTPRKPPVRRAPAPKAG